MALGIRIVVHESGGVRIQNRGDHMTAEHVIKGGNDPYFDFEDEFDALEHIGTLIEEELDKVKEEAKIERVSTISELLKAGTGVTISDPSRLAILWLS